MHPSIVFNNILMRVFPRACRLAGLKALAFILQILQCSILHISSSNVFDCSRILFVSLFLKFMQKNNRHLFCAQNFAVLVAIFDVLLLPCIYKCTQYIIGFLLCAVEFLFFIGFTLFFSFTYERSISNIFHGNCFSSHAHMRVCARQIVHNPHTLALLLFISLFHFHAYKRHDALIFMYV